MKRIFCLLLIGYSLGSMQGCQKSDINLTSQSQYSFDTYFNNSTAINQATVATYATLLHNGLWAREYYFIFDLLGYEAKKTTNLQGDLAQLADYNFGTNQPTLEAFWGSLYRLIFRANVVLNRIAVWNPTDPTDQASVKQNAAEVRFLRAYAYSLLVFNYGDVPLVTSYDTIIQNNYPARTAAATIWSFVETELIAAAADLPISYDAGTDLGRATQGAALSLLGRTYLYEKKWADAQSTLLKVVQSGSYSLDPSYANLFSTTNQSSPENIFQIMNAPWTDWGIGNQYYVFGGQETWGGKATHSDRAQEYGWADWNNTYVTTTAVNAFHYANPVDATPYIDPRAKETFYGDAASGGDPIYCQQCTPCPSCTPPVSVNMPFPFQASDAQGDYKWKKYEYYNLVPLLNGPQSAINGQVIRYADVLLMLAEAYIQQGDFGTNPLGLINQVRARAGAVQYPSLTDATTAMTILMRERQLEFTGEQLRYYDLMRWGLSGQVINSERAAEPGDGTQPFQSKNVLFPIPNTESDYNPNVIVNNGWN
jgi:hypothetical protein